MSLCSCIITQLSHLFLSLIKPNSAISTILSLSPEPNSGFSTIMSTDWCSPALTEVSTVSSARGTVDAIVSSKSVLSSLRPLNGVEAEMGVAKDWFGVSDTDGAATKRLSANRGFTMNIFNLLCKLKAKRELMPPGTACCSLNQLHTKRFIMTCHLKRGQRTRAC